MDDNGKRVNDTPELRDALRSIGATREDESGLASDKTHERGEGGNQNTPSNATDDQLPSTTISDVNDA